RDRPREDAEIARGNPIRTRCLASERRQANVPAGPVGCSLQSSEQPPARRGPNGAIFAGDSEQSRAGANTVLGGTLGAVLGSRAGTRSDRATCRTTGGCAGPPLGGVVAAVGYGFLGLAVGGLVGALWPQ